VSRPLYPAIGWLVLIFVSCGAALGGPARQRPEASVDAEFFRKEVRPVLLERCAGCHGGAEPAAGLNLTTRSGVLRGAARKPQPSGDHAARHLLSRVSAGTMPPQGKLPAAQVAAIRRWVNSGLPWAGGPLDPLRESTSRRAGLDWWSLQPLQEVQPPPTAAAKPGETIPAASRAIDAFVRARLLRAGLDFAPEAPREVFIRRVTFDLHGLPPTLPEIEAFRKDARPDAYERLVDRLLASPRYGERAARRWLDTVRFAESDGFEHDMPRLNAWPYRDWVIDAFNQDMPYDRFVREQLAGDAYDPADPKAAIPTGFLVAGCFDSVGAKQAAENFRAEVRQDELEDMVGTTTQVFLGMTAQCARCHDHKYDPITQKDYYRLQAALAGAQHFGAEGKSPYYTVRSVKPPSVFVLKRGAVTAREEEVQPGGLSALRMLPADLSPATHSDPERRRTLAEWLTDPRNPLFKRVVVNRVWGWLFGEGLVATPNDFGFNGDRPSHPELLDYLASLFSSAATSNEADREIERGRDRGRSRSLHPSIAPSLYPGMAWSLKALHRALVLSRTYRQSSRLPQRSMLNAQRLDSGNRLLWRHAPRRLESEELRDAMLSISGKLNPGRGGPGFQLFTWKSNAGALYESIDPEGEEYCRRAVYRMVVRGTEDPLLTGFDCPDPSATTPRRQTTTTATQALSLLNNRFVDRQSGHLAEALRREAEGLPAQVRLSFQRALGREPRAEETARALEMARRHGLKAWCRVLFNTSDFLYVE
jgi:mono/diheme cytochrome c family protein